MIPLKFVLVFMFWLSNASGNLKSEERINWAQDDLPGVYMVEFSADDASDTKSLLFRHFQALDIPEHRLLFRTSVKTKLFHGHSFEITGEHEYKHISSIPGVIGVHKVRSVPAPKPFKPNYESDSGSFQSTRKDAKASTLKIQNSHHPSSKQSPTYLRKNYDNEPIHTITGKTNIC